MKRPRAKDIASDYQLKGVLRPGLSPRTNRNMIMNENGKNKNDSIKKREKWADASKNNTVVFYNGIINGLGV